MNIVYALRNLIRRKLVFLNPLSSDPWVEHSAREAKPIDVDQFMAWCADHNVEVVDTTRESGGIHGLDETWRITPRDEDSAFEFKVRWGC